MERVSTISTLTTRRPRWQYPAAQPTPRILHLPRRPRSRKVVPKAANAAAKPTAGLQKDRKGKLEALFDQERQFARGVLPIVMVSSSSGVKNDDDDDDHDDRFGEEERKRERVEERESAAVVEEEKWRFQAEMLRAECNLLRMEKEIAVKKMERRRVLTEKILKSTVQTLLSGRKGICDGKEVKMVLEEEIQELVDKLQRLRRRSGAKDSSEVRDTSNFDKQASLLQRRLHKFGGESDKICVKETQEMAEATLSIKTTTCNVNENIVSTRSFNIKEKDMQMEILRRKMEVLSKGTLLERMEDEYGSLLSAANSSAATSASTSTRIEFPDMSSSSFRQPLKDSKQLEKRACSGCCKVIVRRVIEQVRAETEQWSQMQEMLRQVRDEMEQLQASRDFWEDQALKCDHQIQALQSTVQEWQGKAVSSAAKVNELQVQLSKLQTEFERLKKAKERARTKNIQSLALDLPIENEMEKRVLVCHSKENCHAQKVSRRKNQACSRSPFEDIGNLSPLATKKAVF